MTEESRNSNAETLDRYRRRQSRLYRWWRAPRPLIHNAAKRRLPHCEGRKRDRRSSGFGTSLGSSNVDTEPFPGVDVGRWKSADRACIEPGIVRSFYRFSMRADADSIALLSAWLYRVAS